MIDSLIYDMTTMFVAQCLFETDLQVYLELVCHTYELIVVLTHWGRVHQ